MPAGAGADAGEVWPAAERVDEIEHGPVPAAPWWGGGHTWWEPVRESEGSYGFGSTEISLVAGS